MSRGPFKPSKISSANPSKVLPAEIIQQNKQNTKTDSVLVVAGAPGLGCGISHICVSGQVVTYDIYPHTYDPVFHLKNKNCPGCRRSVECKVPFGKSTFVFNCPLCAFSEQTNTF